MQQGAAVKKRPDLTVVPPQGRGPTKGGASHSNDSPPIKDLDTFEILTRHEEATMRLRALLEGIYNTSISGNAERTDAGTITTLCSLAKAEVTVIDEVFKTITAKKED